jgi:aldose 1-epimerase
MSELITGTERVTLQAGPASMQILPSLGGGVLALDWEGGAILRPSRVPRDRGLSPLETAGFPLIPYSGRIRNGRFSWQGETIALAANFPPEPHSIHGGGWLTNWNVLRASENTVALEFVHRRGDWPWAYRAHQLFTLRPDGLNLRMSIRNEDRAVMPAGLGWHPYFLAEGAFITANTVGGWQRDAEGLPVALSGASGFADLRCPQRVAALDLDTPFIAPKAQVDLRWPDQGLGVSMTASEPFNHLVVFTPPGQDFFCVEPASHVPDAHNLALCPKQTGLVTLRPGEALAGSIDLSFRRL